MGDYAKEFHNIRRLKFSHNGGSESRREGGGREGEKRKKKGEKRGGMRRPRRLGIGPRFLFVLSQRAAL